MEERLISHRKTPSFEFEENFSPLKAYNRQQPTVHESKIPTVKKGVTFGRLPTKRSFETPTSVQTTHAFKTAPKQIGRTIQTPSSDSSTSKDPQKLAELEEKNLQDRIRLLTTQKGILKQKIQKASADLATNQDRIAQKQQSLDECQVMLTDLQNTAQWITSAAEAKNAELLRLQQEYQTNTADYETMQSQIIEYESQAKRTQKSLDATSAEISALTETHEQLLQSKHEADKRRRFWKICGGVLASIGSAGAAVMASFYSVN